MHIITRFLTWLLDLAENKIIARNIQLNADLNTQRGIAHSLATTLEEVNYNRLRERVELSHACTELNGLREGLNQHREALGAQTVLNQKLVQELVTLRSAARKSDKTAIVSSDNVRGVQDKFNQLKRHGRALRYSIGQACEEIEKIAKTLEYFRLGYPLDRVEAASKLRQITRQMRALGCIPPDAGSIPAKPEDFISDFNPGMLEDNPLDGFKPAREIVGGLDRNGQPMVSAKNRERAHQFVEAAKKNSG
jgi:hypothetical protein